MKKTVMFITFIVSNPFFPISTSSYNIMQEISEAIVQLFYFPKRSSSFFIKDQGVTRTLCSVEDGD